MDVGEMQRKLSQWATENPEDQYRDLYSLLCQETWLRVAHHSVNTNQGRETAGIDGRTMSHFNVTTPVDAAVFNMMGAMIVVFQLALLALAIVLVRRPMSNRRWRQQSVLA